MNVNLVCFSDLAKEAGCDFRNHTSYEMKEGQTVRDLIDRAGVRRSDVKIAFVNSRVADFGTVLTHGDRVGLTPAVGGM
jgi:molybdopterin converting factor small subunit